MHVRCSYVAGFEEELGKQIKIIDRNGFIFRDGWVEADWQSCTTPTLRKEGVKAK